MKLLHNTHPTWHPTVRPCCTQIWKAACLLVVYESLHILFTYLGKIRSTYNFTQLKILFLILSDFNNYYVLHKISFLKNSRYFFTFMWPCIVTNLFIIRPTRCTNFANFIFSMKLYMFRTVHLSIIRSSFTLHSAMVYVIQVCRQLSSRSICCLWRWNRQSVPKRRHINFRRRGITQKKAYNIQYTTKVWNQDYFLLSLITNYPVKTVICAVVVAQTPLPPIP